MNKKVWGYICIQNSVIDLGKDIGFFGAAIYPPDPYLEIYWFSLCLSALY